jgi:hypothetical protein
MEWLKTKGIRLLLKVGGFFFLIGATAFTIAYFTTDIPDPNEYVNSQATIIQYAYGDEL